MVFTWANVCYLLTYELAQADQPFTYHYSVIEFDDFSPGDEPLNTGCPPARCSNGQWFSEREVLRWTFRGAWVGMISVTPRSSDELQCWFLGDDGWDWWSDLIIVVVLSLRSIAASDSSRSVTKSSSAARWRNPNKVIRDPADAFEPTGDELDWSNGTEETGDVASTLLSVSEISFWLSCDTLKVSFVPLSLET